MTTVTLEVSIIRPFGSETCKMKDIYHLGVASRRWKRNVVWAHDMNARTTLNPAFFGFLRLQ